MATILTQFDFTPAKKRRKKSNRPSSKKFVPAPLIDFVAAIQNGTELPLYRIEDCKQVKGYPFTDKVTGEVRFGHFKFKCFRITLVHQKARPGELTTVLYSCLNGMPKYTVTTSKGIVKSMGQSEWMQYAPGKFGDSVFQQIMLLLS